MRGGWGTMFYENGDKYEGEWDADVRHGSGTIFFGAYNPFSSFLLTFEQQTAIVSRGDL